MLRLLHAVPENVILSGPDYPKYCMLDEGTALCVQQRRSVAYLFYGAAHQQHDSAGNPTGFDCVLLDDAEVRGCCHAC